MAALRAASRTGSAVSPSAGRRGDSSHRSPCGDGSLIANSRPPALPVSGPNDTASTGIARVSVVEVTVVSSTPPRPRRQRNWMML